MNTNKINEPEAPSASVMDSFVRPMVELSLDEFGAKNKAL